MKRGAYFNRIADSIRSVKKLPAGDLSLTFSQTYGGVYPRSGAGTILGCVSSSAAVSTNAVDSSALPRLAAAASGAKMPTVNLEAIVNKIGPVTAALKDFFSGDELINIAVQANVAHSANDLLKHSPILQKEVAEKKLTVIKAVYRLKSGEVMRLG